jgi:hypothetical protein
VPPVGRRAHICISSSVSRDDTRIRRPCARREARGARRRGFATIRRDARQHHGSVAGGTA